MLRFKRSIRTRIFESHITNIYLLNCSVQSITIFLNNGNIGKPSNKLCLIFVLTALKVPRKPKCFTRTACSFIFFCYFFKKMMLTFYNFFFINQTGLSCSLITKSNESKFSLAKVFNNGKII